VLEEEVEEGVLEPSAQVSVEWAVYQAQAPSYWVKNAVCSAVVQAVIHIPAWDMKAVYNEPDLALSHIRAREATKCSEVES
jgi:hypothetical protein